MKPRDLAVIGYCLTGPAERAHGQTGDAGCDAFDLGPDNALDALESSKPFLLLSV